MTTSISGDALQPREERSCAGSYISAGGCTNSTGTGGVTEIFTDIDNFGKISGVSDKAKDLASKLPAKVADTAHHIGNQPKVSAFEFATISGQCYTVGGVELDALNQSVE
ncbi:MAG: hypothetical protein JO309_09260 [Pseudonocardiales bacterium]|nr:hypothetical protein [Pseudonocardiales bacterium]MBV9729572.1 hypothetical protein [Pseudonocardiales bacterium]